MSSLLEADQPRPGLRERKKAKTRAIIQEQALRLFREHGYDATTIESIAEAAEVSPSTFFRYFPTKEDVVLYDAIDPIAIEAFRRQPPDMTPIQAFRAAMNEVVATLNAQQVAEQRQRSSLIFSAPALRAAALDDALRTLEVFSEIVAERVGRSPDDLMVRSFVGAITGALLAALLPAFVEGSPDFGAQMDQALDFVEEGFRF